MTADGPAAPPIRGLVGGVITYFRVSILAVVALVVAGSWALVTMPRMEDPEFDVRDGVVRAAWPGVSPSRIETLVTRPLESALSELEEVTRLRSYSTSGLSTVVFRAAAGEDPPVVLDLVRARVRELRMRLPEGVREPEVEGFNTAFIPALVVAVTGSERYEELEAWSREVVAALDGLRGVARVEVEGAPRREILVAVDNERLSQYRVPLTRISEVLARENASLPGGKLDVGPRRFLVQNPNELTSLEAIRDTVIGSSGDAVVLLRDVAEVSEGLGDHRYRTRHDGRPCLLVSVIKQARTNTIAVTARARRALLDVDRRLPAAFEAPIVSDRGRSVEALLDNLTWNALAGGLIVVLVVTLFMGLRQAIVVSTSIPLSILVALLCMRGAGVDLHQVSILGLVLALGMLVDSALVVVESATVRLERGEPIASAVVRGVEEVKWPVTSSALTTIAAFAPLLALGGDVGRFIQPLPATLIFALAGSLGVALTVVPLLTYALWKWFPPPPSEERPSRLLARYRELARWALRHRAITLAIAVGAFVLALATIPTLGLQFFPKAEKRFFLVNIRLPGDASLERTDLVTAQVEGILAAEAAIESVTANVGRGGPEVYYNEVRENESPTFAQLLVRLSDSFEGSTEGYAVELGRTLRGISGASVEPKVLSQGPVTGGDVVVRISGDDLDVLAGLAREVRTRLAGVRGLSDVRDSLGDRVPRLALELDKKKAALRGVDSYAFAQTVYTALNGHTATRLRGESEEIPVVVRLDRRSMHEVEHLAQLYIPSRIGTMVPMREIATVEEVGDYAKIYRRDRRRLVKIDASVSGRLVADAAREVEGLLGDLPLPEGYELVLGGRKEGRQEAFGTLGQAMALGVLLIYAILAIQFNSFVQPFVILFTVPFGITGAILGLALTSNPFGFMAFVGVVSLTGIIVNDSIVLTDFANYLQRVEGKGMYAALLEAGTRRFEPVMLTSLTTITGMLPLAIWGGSLWSPLATALIFGLALATLLILLILPVIYSLLVGPREGRRQFNLWVRLGRRLVRRETGGGRP